MTRFIDFLVEILERIGRLFGLGRRRPAAPDDPFVEPRRSPLRRVLSVLPGLLLVLAIVYVGVLIYRFDFYRGMDLQYPQRVLPAEDRYPEGPGVQPAAAAEPGTQGTGDGAAQAQCAPSRIVEMQMALIDLMVNRNDWAPGAPQYRLGFFGLVDFEDTPWFDNKAAFQLGMLDITRRLALDLADTLGRVRGTSEVDSDLQAAQARLRTNPRAWVINNPFDPQLQMVTQSAAASYRGAIPLYAAYNERLTDCEALFDTRRDNLRTLLDRIAADVGSMASRLQARSQAISWSVEQGEFVEAPGNNYGWFDFRADNLFHQARGQLFALHGLMQAVRRDFSRTIEQSDLGQVWDRMEAHLAEGARLNPLIVSNGREDGLLAPDHLSVMGEKVLRARANMTELRDILDR